MYNEFWAKISCIILFIAFNVTFLPQFVMGSQGMPRRYFNYIPEFQTMHQVSTVGSWLLGIGFLIILAYMTHSYFRGKKAATNPWGGRTMEWMTASPPIHHNFEHTPVVIHGPYDHHKPVREFRMGIVGSENGHGHPVNGDKTPAGDQPESKQES